MFINFHGAFIIIIEILCCKIFYETFDKNMRFNKFVSYCLIVLLMILVYLLAILLPEHFLIKQILIILLTAFIMSIYSDVTIKKSIVLSLTFQSILLVIDYCTYSIISYWIFTYKNIEARYLSFEMLIVVFGKLCLFLLLLLIKIKSKKMVTLIETEWKKFIFFPIFTICIIASMLSVFKFVETINQANILFIIAIGLVGLNIAVFYLINDILEREYKILEQKMFIFHAKNQMNMYRSISENYNKQKQKAHEYKNQIMCIEALLQRNQFEELNNYIGNIRKSLHSQIDTINTNNVIINSIINTKHQESLEKNIVFVVKVNDLSNIRISDEDIVIILSNLLNNAIEAAEKCVKDKVIKLKFLAEDDEIILSVKNTFSHPLNYKNGIFETTKNSKEEHGIGMKNIIKIIEKYDGIYVVKNSEEEFYFSIMIPK
ncbi:sensor histidine kinase [Konateibacter massiliensis]|uniref:sensor histidine kinase n=1 Tax=Konateibacter massiliensis TaxID=2002841 RepID=UPI001F469B96|nr:GHKL domain-containing protein [Konateibacter massiliensis]